MNFKHYALQEIKYTMLHKLVFLSPLPNLTFVTRKIIDLQPM